MNEVQILVTKYIDLKTAMGEYYVLLERKIPELAENWKEFALHMRQHVELLQAVLQKIEENPFAFSISKNFDPKAIEWMTGELRTAIDKIVGGSIPATYMVDFIHDIEKSHIVGEGFACLAADSVEFTNRLVAARQGNLAHRNKLLGIPMPKNAQAEKRPVEAAKPAEPSLLHKILAKRAKVGEVLELPHPAYVGLTSLEECLKVRRSTKEFTDAPVALNHLSQMLFAAQGITDPRGFRTVPSALALYPLELLVVAGDVTGLAPSVYVYDAFEHQLKRTIAEDPRAALAAACQGQVWVETAPLLVVFTAFLSTHSGLPLETVRSFALLEAGHAAQNLCLQACARRLDTIPVGTFKDSDVRKILHLPDQQLPVYILCVGQKAG